MTAQWYVSQHGKQLGPFTPMQLQEMASAGKLTPDDLVTQAGGSKWTPAKQVKGLSFRSAAVQPTLPPLPPLLPPLPSSPNADAGLQLSPSTSAPRPILPATLAAIALYTIVLLVVLLLLMQAVKVPDRYRYGFEQPQVWRMYRNVFVAVFLICPFTTLAALVTAFRSRHRPALIMAGTAAGLMLLTCGCGLMSVFLVAKPADKTFQGVPVQPAPSKPDR